MMLGVFSSNGECNTVPEMRELCERLVSLGFNAICFTSGFFQFHHDTNDLLSVADEHNIKVVFAPHGEVKTWVRDSPDHSIESARATFGPYLQRLKDHDHSSLVGFSLVDDAIIDWKARLQTVKQVFREYFPNLPAVPMLVGGPHQAVFNPTDSRLLTYLYWCGYYADGSPLLEGDTRKVSFRDFGDGTAQAFFNHLMTNKPPETPVWLGVQSHQTHPRLTSQITHLRYPTPAEMTQILDFAERNGVEGVFVFCWESIASGEPTLPEKEWLGLGAPGSEKRLAAVTSWIQERQPVGVLPRPIDWSQPLDPEAWWADSPYNPASLTYRPPGTIGHPVRSVDVASEFGGDINAALAAVADETTLWLRNREEPYPRAEVAGRTKIHVIGESQAGVTWRGWDFYGSPLAKNYTDFAGGLVRDGLPEYRAAWKRPARDIYVGNLKVDTGPLVPVYAQNHFVSNTGMFFRLVRDVLIENVDFAATPWPSSVQWHAGHLNGNVGIENLWIRGCTFRSQDGSTVRHNFATFIDGGRNCGVVNSRLIGTYRSGGHVRLTHDDYSGDLNGSGTVEIPRELWDAKLIIFSDIIHEGNTNVAIEITGGYSLIEKLDLRAIQNWAVRQAAKPCRLDDQGIVYQERGLVIQDVATRNLMLGFLEYGTKEAHDPAATIPSKVGGATLRRCTVNKGGSTHPQFDGQWTKVNSAFQPDWPSVVESTCVVIP